MSATIANRNGLALSDQPGVCVTYFLSHCAHYAEAKRRAQEMRDQGDPLWEFVELLAKCYQDETIKQGYQYRVEISADPRARRWLAHLGVPTASAEELRALAAEDAATGRHTLALQAADDYFAAIAAGEAP